MQRKKLYIVDGNAYYYRAYYALGNLSAPNGQPIGAVYGFTSMLSKLKAKHGVDYLAVCFDVKGQTFRHKKYADYKAQRKPMPDDLQVQVPIIKKIVSAYNVPFFEKQGYEADDLIASLAYKFKESINILIASPDKDLLQLVDKYVKIYNPQKNEIIDRDKVLELYHILPEQFADFLALTGDSADNIPGVPGIGPKTAADLLGQFSCLEEILASNKEIKSEKTRKALASFSQQAEQCKELVCICENVSLPIDLKQLQNTEENIPELKIIFQELGFKHFLANLDKSTPDEPDGISVITISVKEQLPDFTQGLEKISIISLFVRTDEKYNIVGFDLNDSSEKIFRFIISSNLRIEDCAECLNKIFGNTDILKIGYDLKTSCGLFAKAGIHLECPFFDFMIADYLLNPGFTRKGFASIFSAYMARNANSNILAIEQFNLKSVLAAELKEKQLWDLFCNVEMPLIKVLSCMQIAGIKINPEILNVLNTHIDKKLKHLTAKIYETSGFEFNINSPKQLGEVLFKNLKMPVLKKGKSGPSTDGEVLARLAQEHSLPKLVLEYRELAKLKSTYISGLLELADRNTCKLHTSFNQAVTATGRLSSSTPNLQNIPVKTETGAQIREAFVAGSPEHWLVSADYSQIELRVLAHLSQDENLITAFNHDLDIHIFTAALIFGVERHCVSKDMRGHAKRINFGIIYGMGPQSLAKDIRVSVAEAKVFIAEYFKRYPGVKNYMQEQIKQAQLKGYVTTLLGRRRYIPQINSKNSMQRSFSERAAMNTPIQGTAADLIKIAMIKIHNIFKEQDLQSVMAIQVHDELVFDVPDSELSKVRQIVQREMENVLELSVPIKITLKQGRNWRDSK
ncbi:MAG: DNA polymerase I [Candidatus Omnitrophota bacterium]|nr:MAG: DNA polymerase I [Candidatus Omnitrophota bacterium]